MMGDNNRMAPSHGTLLIKWVTKCVMGWVTNYKAFIETNMTEYCSSVYELPSHLTLSLNSLKWPRCDNINKITHLT